MGLQSLNANQEKGSLSPEQSHCIFPLVIQF